MKPVWKVEPVFAALRVIIILGFLWALLYDSFYNEYITGGYLWNQ